MLRSRLLRAAEPAWKHFFTADQTMELDYIRCFKDTSDVYRLLYVLRESFFANSFADMTDTEILKGLTVYNYIHSNARRIGKDINVVESFFNLAKSRVESNTIDWTSQNLNYICDFIANHQYFALESFSQSTIATVFQNAVNTAAVMRLPHLACAVVSSSSAPSFYPTLYSALVAKFNTTQRFTDLNSEELRVLTRALLLRPQLPESAPQPVPVSSRSFKLEALQALQAAIIARLGAGHFDIIHVVDIMEAFHKLVDKQDSHFDDHMMNWLLKLLDPAEDMYLKSIELQPYQIIELAAHISPASPKAKEIFRLASNRFFLKHVMTKGPHSMVMQLKEKIPVIINYIRVAAIHKVFQVVYLDQAVNYIVEMLDSSTHIWTINSISEALRSLAELNYAGRFNPAMISKEYQWQAWQKLLARSETAILKRITSTAQESEDEEGESESGENPLQEVSLGDTKSELIDVLWAFAVFDHYSKPFLSEVLSSLSLQSGHRSEEELAKLLQVHFWLKLEYMGEFKLEPQVEADILAYKAKRDREQPSAKPRSELKQTIAATLQARKQQFIENYREFPYELDFASVGEKLKEAVIVEDDSSYLDGSEGLVRSGRKRLELRQLTHLNWAVKRISLKTWLKTGHLDLFTNRS